MHKYLLTGLVIALAVIGLVYKYWDYVVNPWTRDGQVRAEVVQVTPRVSGPIVELAVKDNQFVQQGALLFRVDPRTYQAAFDQAQAQYDKALDNYQSMLKQVDAAAARVEVARAAVAQAQSAIKESESEIAKDRAEFRRQQELLPQRATSQRSLDLARASYEVSVEKREGALASLTQSQASLSQAQADLGVARANLGAPGESNAGIRTARAALEEARLNLQFTEVRAPVSGFVTNLTLRIGTQAVANQPMVALIDSNSFWVQGFFRETLMEQIRVGNPAVVTLMSYPDKPLVGVVDSIGWGIAQQDGSTGYELLPAVNPSFEWIRLAERIPVRIHLTEIPKGVSLRAGTTASVLIRTGSGRSSPPVALPTPLQ
ncbi:HlyD family secretion protein [Aestuariirhabdus litorea]|uniref:HlyD family secretion protein n=1 Tax=Aestuariirhabdus litorea TaxID=2528527 RepID=A0A3P3VSX6_9GAMM|nr:HlyD family secretion protein [Aestuariirhabdus litorea]RWW98641.1 biotin/lipoyl-binding protein [Endozoicomonadaceae bacterium GTF-13]